MPLHRIYTYILHGYLENTETNTWKFATRCYYGAIDSVKEAAASGPIITLAYWS
jgi:hypothetical protein